MFLLLYGTLLYAATSLLEVFNVQKISSLAKLGYTPKIFCLVNFFNLAGLPPLAGFFVKLFLLKVVVGVASMGVVFFLLASSVLVLFAYVVVVYYSIRSPASAQPPRGPHFRVALLALSIFS
jgi:NADH-quinone oxidoreductase subunit N